jgi:predicted porin
MNASQFYHPDHSAVVHQSPVRLVRRAHCALSCYATRSVPQVLQALNTQRHGLAFDEVLRRLIQNGPNQVRVLRSSPPDLTQVVQIMKKQTCQVRRDLTMYDLARDHQSRVPARMLVIGDIVLLSAGDYVPADLRLIHQDHLILNRAILQAAPDTCAMGDRVVAGTAHGVVVATGNQTLLGVLMREPVPVASGWRRVLERSPFQLSKAAALAAGVALFGLAGALTPGHSHAETSVQLYGTLDAGLGWTRVSGEGSQRDVLSGGQTDSLWGIRGHEDLGDGLRATFNLESGIDLATGRAEESDRLFNYQAWLGLGSDNWGELRFGRQYTVGQEFVSAIASDNYQISNQFSWRSPQWAGMQLGASYSADVGEQGMGGSRRKLYSVALRYEEGPWLLGAGYESLSRVESNRPTAWQLGASYDFEVARLAAGWSRQSNGFVGLNGDDGPAHLKDKGLEGLGPAEFINGGRLDTWYVGTAIPVGKGEFQLQWSLGRPNWSWEDTDERARRIQVMSVGYVHALSPRTSVYAFAAQGRRFDMETAASASEPRSSRVALGVTHHF